MSGEDKFKKSLDELLNSKEFAFDEASWEKAKDLIDASKRRRRVMPWLIAASLFIGLGTAGYFVLQPHDLPKVAAVAVEPTDKITSEPSNVSNTVEQDLPANTNTEGNTEIKQKNIEQSQPSAPQRLNSPETVSDHTGGNATVTMRKTNTRNAVPAQNNVSETKSPVTKPVNETKSDDEESAVLNNSESPAKIVEQPNSDNEVSQPLATKTKEDKSTTNKISDETPAPVANAAASNTSNDIKEEETKKIEPITENAAPIAVDSAATAVVARPDTDYVKLKNPMITLEAGTTYMRGYNTEEGIEGSGFNPLIGINYMNHLSSKWAIGLGLQYTSVSRLNYSQYTTKITRIGLGEQSEVTVYTPSRLHYLVLPFKVYYQLNAANTFGAGLNVANLLTVDCTVEKYTERNGVSANHHTTKDRGYTQGFNSFDTQLSAFYRRKLYKDFFLHAEVFYGLSDVKDNSFWTPESKERNSGVKLSLVYTLIKSK